MLAQRRAGCQYVGDLRRGRAASSPRPCAAGTRCQPRRGAVSERANGERVQTVNFRTHEFVCRVVQPLRSWLISVGRFATGRGGGGAKGFGNGDARWGDGFSSHGLKTDETWGFCQTSLYAVCFYSLWV